MKPPIEITSPCTADWQKMTGDDRKRLCAQCNKHVHNLSALTPRELEKFAAERTGTECIGYVYRPDGTIETASRWSWLWRWLNPLRTRTAWLLAVLLPSIFGAGCAPRATLGRACPSPVAAGGIMPPPPKVKNANVHDGQIILGKTPVATTPPKSGKPDSKPGK
jgi:hypothetical protein